MNAIIERLSQHNRLRAVPLEELEWLAAHGEMRTLARGDLLSRAGDPRAAHHLNIVLSGRISVYVERPRVRRKIHEVRAGDFSGLLPFSRMTHSTADLVVDEPVDLLHVDSGLFPELIRECPAVTEACVHSMLDRAQALTESHLQEEKLFALGKLAAGLAHELNNPAAAALRSIELLSWRQAEVDAAASTLADAALGTRERDSIREFRSACLNIARVEESPIARADREESLVDWLDTHGIEPVFADSLAEARVTAEQLETLAVGLPPAAIRPALAWAASSVAARRLVGEISQAVKRVHDLVASVKSFTQMDRPLVPEPTQIVVGVRDTVAIMEPKARTRSVTVDVEVSDELPLVRASAAELNQLWAILLDNALDAAPTSSRVVIAAKTSSENVLVSVVDAGNGIPNDIRGRIFDPFFTTKPIGQGRGLGLDTARKIVALMGGAIEVESAPGRTEFCVSLPTVASG
jgi:signal transduction histidine kinase